MSCIPLFYTNLQKFSGFHSNSFLVGGDQTQQFPSVNLVLWHMLYIHITRYNFSSAENVELRIFLFQGLKNFLRTYQLDLQVCIHKIRTCQPIISKFKVLLSRLLMYTCFILKKLKSKAHYWKFFNFSFSLYCYGKTAYCVFIVIRQKVEWEFFIHQFLLSHNLVYNGGFQTLNCRYSFGIQLMWQKFCVA